MKAAENQSESRSRQSHWDSVYERLAPEGVSWYEPEASLSLALVEGLRLPPDTPIIDVGGGASTFVDGLVARGYTDVSVLDLSGKALSAARHRLGPDAPVHWLHEDLLNWIPDRRYGLWHDRAVYHFLTEAEDQKRYLSLLQDALADRGRVIMAVFAPDGPQRCSGLPVARYGVEELTAALGSRFELVESRRQGHTTPSGKLQSFTWVVARMRPV